MAFHMTTNQTLTSSRQACLIGVTPNNVENRTAQVRRKRVWISDKSHAFNGGSGR